MEHLRREGRARTMATRTRARDVFGSASSAALALIAACRLIRGVAPRREPQLAAGRYELILTGVDQAALTMAFPEAVVRLDGRHCRVSGRFDDARMTAAVGHVALLGGRVLGVLCADRLPVRDTR